MEMNSGTNRSDYRRQVPRYRSNNTAVRRDMYGTNSFGNRQCGCNKEPESVNVSSSGGCGCGSVSKAQSDCGCQEKSAYYMKDKEKKKDCPKVNSRCSAFEEQFPVGMAYVPMQEFTDIYEEGKALQKGTIFAQLDYPFLIGFCAGRCGCK